LAAPAVLLARLGELALLTLQLLLVVLPVALPAVDDFGSLLLVLPAPLLLLPLP
jgi:hypothetical protein